MPSSLALPSSAVSVARSPLRSSAVPATPRPDLLFAIAADDPDAVRRVLEDGAADVNDAAGPQSALSFAMTNKSLKKRVEIVRTLLAFGANVKKAREKARAAAGEEAASGPAEALATEGAEAVPETDAGPDEPAAAVEEMDPVTRCAGVDRHSRPTAQTLLLNRYYVSKAEDPQVQRSTALMQRSTFQPLTQVRYDLIGQDRALEQLFRVLSMHSQQKHKAPIVVMLCGRCFTEVQRRDLDLKALI